MKRKAFTLVELMVVIAIIALLVSILLPSLSSVISLTRATICMNNLNKLGQAFVLGSAGRVIGGGGGCWNRNRIIAIPVPGFDVVARRAEGSRRRPRHLCLSRG